MAKKSFNRKDKSNPTQSSLKSGDLQEKICKKAYEFFERRGYSHGSDLSDWLEAERIIKSQIR